MRFYAVLAVFLFHYYNISIGLVDNLFCQQWASIFKGAGYLGVDFFFTLSGFLITSILLSKSTFDLGRFYLKRALRLVPLYSLIVVLSYVVLPLLFSQQKVSLPPLGYVLSFTANGFYAINGDNYLFAITILWSISIEMQFYLLWGAALRFFKQYIYWITALLILFSLLVKYMLYSKCSLYYLTATYVPDFMIGALGAKILSEGLINMSMAHKGIKASLYLAVILVFVLTPFLNTFFAWKMVSNCVFSVLTIAIIMDQCAEGSLFELGKSKLVSYLGKVSYGLYCFQGFVLPLYTKFLLSHFIDSGSAVKVLLIPFLLFVFTGLLAAMSYRFFESYFLGLKERV